MIYKRANSPYWYAAFYVKRIDGKLIKRAICTKTEDEAKAREFEKDLTKGTRELAEKKRVETFLTQTAEILTNTTIQNPGLAISLIWDKYSTDHTQINRTERTQKSKRQVWDRFKAWLEKNYSDCETINDVSRDIASAYIKTIQDKKAATFNNEKNSLSSIWQVLTVPAGLKENVWRLFKGAESDSVRYRDFNMAEMKSILDHSNDFWRVAVAIGFYTGLRFKDVVYLRKSQIQGDYISLTPAKTKRKNKDVTIFIHPILKRILDGWLINSQPEQDYVFPDAVENYDKPDFQRAFGKILDASEIKANERGIVGFHSLRHTFVTINEELGTDRKIIQGAVGHGSPVMTGHYSHDKKSSIAIGKMPSLLE